MLQIVVSLTDNSTGIIYDRNIFIVQATGVSHFCLVQYFGFRTNKVAPYTTQACIRIGQKHIEFTNKLA